MHATAETAEPVAAFAAIPNVVDEDGRDPAMSAREAALARVMDKLSRHPDFPSLGDAMSDVRRVARSERSRLQALAASLMKDVGLSHKVLRLANAVHYRSVGGGYITTLSRAIAVMGFTEVAQLAVTSRLIDQLRDKRHSMALREEFLRALLAGSLGHELAHRRDLQEEAHVASVFRNLGRMMACLHFSSEALAVRNAVPRSTWPRGPAEQQASASLLGVDYGHLGVCVAERWGWPDTLRRAMRHEAMPLHAPTQREGRLRCLAAVANDLADLLLYVDPQCWDARCEDLAAEAGAATGHDTRSLRAAMAVARDQLDKLAELLEMPLSQRPEWEGALDPLNGADRAASAMPPGRRDASTAAARPGAAPLASMRPAASAQGRDVPPGPEPARLAAAAAVEAPPRPAAPALDLPQAPGSAALPAVLPHRSPEALLHAVQSVVDTLAQGGDGAQVQTLIVQALLNGLGAQRVVMCLAQGPLGPLRGQFGLAPGRDPATEHFEVARAGVASRTAGVGADLFSLLCERGADMLVREAADPAVASRLPVWWRQRVAARSFLVLPMRLGQQPVGMIYVDSDRPGGLVIDEQEMKLVRLLRSQALVAWKQGV